MNLPKIENMTSSRGNIVANQFIIDTDTHTIFQSYNSIIATVEKATGLILLDERYWDYSTTTGKYRNMFLNEQKKETEKKIKEGIYTLVNLN